MTCACTLLSFSLVRPAVGRPPAQSVVPSRLPRERLQAAGGAPSRERQQQSQRGQAQVQHRGPDRERGAVGALGQGLDRVPGRALLRGQDGV